ILRSTDGTELWSRPVPGNVGLVGAGGAPTIADFDADGRPEIGVANGARYSVFDIGCSEPAPDEPDCMGDGIRWSNPTDDSSSGATGSAVFDFDGDGAAEVVYNDQSMFRIYDGRTGVLDFSRPNSSRTRTEYPVIADVDNDGSAEIVFAGN